MFDYIRNNTRLMGFLLALLIVPAFVLVGVDGYRNFSGTGETVAVVAGFSIKKDRWDAAHKQDADRVRANNPSIDAQVLDSERFKYASLETLVREQVLGTFVQKNHVGISDQRLASELQRDQFIASLRKPDGSIDIERYREALSRQGMTPAAYEQTVRQDIAKSQVLQSIERSGLQTPAIAKLAIDPFFERREVQMVRFQPANYLSHIKASQADSEKYYTDHQDQFKIQEQVDIEYLVLDMAAITQSIQVNAADLRNYYEQNANRYTTAEERRARHILLAVEAKATPSDKEAKQQQATALLLQLKDNPKQFPELAKKHSQDPGSAPNGGDLGFFQKGAMVKAFEEAAFGLKKDDISALVETEFGFHIIQLIDIKPSVQRPFDAVKNELEIELKKQQAQRAFAEKAENFGNLVYEQADSLTPVAEKLKLNVQTAKALVRKPTQGSVPEVLTKEKFLAEIFSADAIKNKQNTSAIETGANQLIAARVLAHRPATVAPFSDVRAQAEQRWMAAEAQRLAQADGEKALTALKAGGNSPAQPKLGPTVVVSRNDPKGLSNEALNAALSVKPTQLPTPIGLKQEGQGYVVVQVNKVLQRDPPSTEVARQEVQQYEQWWASAETMAYYRSLKQQFKVDIKVPKPKDAKDEQANASRQM